MVKHYAGIDMRSAFCYQPKKCTRATIMALDILNAKIAQKRHHT